MELEFNDGLQQPVKYNKRNQFISCNKVVIDGLTVNFYSSEGILLETRQITQEYINKIISYFESKKNLKINFGL